MKTPKSGLGCPLKGGTKELETATEPRSERGESEGARYSADLADQLFLYANTYEDDDTRAGLIRDHVRVAAGPPESLSLGQLVGTSGGLMARRTDEQQRRHLARRGCVEIAENLAHEMAQLEERLDWAEQFPLIFGAPKEDRLGKQNRLLGEAIVRSYDDARARAKIGGAS